MSNGAGSSGRNCAPARPPIVRNVSKYRQRRKFLRPALLRSYHLHCEHEHRITRDRAVIVGSVSERRGNDELSRAADLDSRKRFVPPMDYFTCTEMKLNRSCSGEVRVENR